MGMIYPVLWFSMPASILRGVAEASMVKQLAGGWQ